MSDKTLTAWITGSTRGVGLAIARILLSSGWNVALHGRAVDPASGDLLRIRQDHPDQVSFHSADLNQPDQVRRCCEAILETWGGLDVLVMNAVAPIDRGLVRKSPQDVWQRHFNTSVLGHLHCVQSAYPALKSSSHAHVVAISSSGTRGIPPTHMGAYLAGKAGLESLARSVGAEGTKSGIRSNTVVAGLMETDLTSFMEPEYFALEARQQPSGRLVTPDEVAQTVLDILLQPDKHPNHDVVVTSRNGA